MTKNRAHKRATKALAAKADVRHPDAFYLADTRKLRTPDWGMINFAEGPLRFVGEAAALDHYRPMEVVILAAVEKRWRIVQLRTLSTRPLPDMLAYLREEPTLTILITVKGAPVNPLAVELLSGIHRDLNVAIQDAHSSRAWHDLMPGRVIPFSTEDGAELEPIPSRIPEWHYMTDRPAAELNARDQVEFIHPLQRSAHPVINWEPKDSPGAASASPLAPLSGNFLTAMNEVMGTAPVVSLGEIRYAPGILDPFALVKVDGGDDTAPEAFAVADDNGAPTERPRPKEYAPSTDPNDPELSRVAAEFDSVPLVLAPGVTGSGAPRGEVMDNLINQAHFFDVADDADAELALDVPMVSGETDLPGIIQLDVDGFSRAIREAMQLPTDLIIGEIRDTENTAREGEAPDAFPTSIITGRPGTYRTAAGWARVNDADAILDALRIPREAQKFSTYPDGMFLITGTTCTGKTSTGLALMRRAQVDKGLEAFAIMDSREALGPRLGPATLIPVNNQVEYPAAIREAVERGAKIMLVDGLFDHPETIEAAVDASLSGVLVFATMLSWPEDALERLQDAFQGDGAAEAHERVRQAVRGVVGVQIDGAGAVRGVLAAEVWVKGAENDSSLEPVLTFAESRAAHEAEGTGR